MRVRRDAAGMRRLLLAIPLLLTPTSCLTAALWQEVGERDCPKAAAVALTPVTVAVDCALVVGWVWLESEGHVDHCCCDR